MILQRTFQINAILLGAFSLWVLLQPKLNLLLFLIPFVSCLKYLYYTTKKNDAEPSAEVNYMAWGITTPIMLYLILSLNQIPMAQILGLLLLDIYMIATGYLGEVSGGSRKMSWFVLGCIAFAPILYALLGVSKGFFLAILTIITWSLFPVVWWLRETNQISPEQRSLAYSFLDLTSKGGFILLF